MTLLDHNSPAAIAETSGRISLFEEIRIVLKRPDLSDDALSNVLEHTNSSSFAGLGGTDLMEGNGAPDVRASAIRKFAVPAPNHGLEVPTHDLNPPLAVRFAPLVTRLQRALQSLTPQMKRMSPAVAPIRAKDR